jgi:hypothetical protein
MTVDLFSGFVGAVLGFLGKVTIEYVKGHVQEDADYWKGRDQKNTATAAAKIQEENRKLIEKSRLRVLTERLYRSEQQPTIADSLEAIANFFVEYPLDIERNTSFLREYCREGLIVQLRDGAADPKTIERMKQSARNVDAGYAALKTPW